MSITHLNTNNTLATLTQMQLIKSGRSVIAAVRDADRAITAFEPLGIVPGRQSKPGCGILFIQSGVDVTDPSTLGREVFQGATQVVLALGSVFGRTADGQMGYLDNLTPERVDAQGVAEVAAAAAKYISPTSRSSQAVLPMKTQDDLAVWERLDDVIMGGNSSSTLTVGPAGDGAIWTGDLILEGGGFCGARTKPLSLDLSSYDGLKLRVKTDQGQTLKINIKTDTFSEPEDVYQATIDTQEDGDWTTVYVPWSEFVPVRRAKTVYEGPPLDPSKIKQFGIVYSRFSFNGYPNPAYTPGPFSIEFSDGIQAYKAPRPQIVLVSSAGVERNARIGDDQEARKKDIPIVQLNPGNVLNHKYTGENALRAAGLPYTVVRPTGMSDDLEGPGVLESSQGDLISGKVTRDEVAAVIAAAVAMPTATNKTFEIRRKESADAKGKETTPLDVQRLFLDVVSDGARVKRGLQPFPAPAVLPAPVSEERKKEILNDPRVIDAQKRNAGGRVRTPEESADVKTVVPIDAASNGAKQEEDAASADVPENVREVREWIRKWRAKTLERSLPAEATAATNQNA